MKLNMLRVFKTFFGVQRLKMSHLPRISSTSIHHTQRSLIKVVDSCAEKTAIVTMQRPPVNGFNLELIEELNSAINELEKKKYRGLILTSSLPTVFSAGLDITELINPDENRLRKFWLAFQELWKTLYVSPLITIAAVNGHAPAGGCLLALACDHSIMVNVDKYTIGLPASKLGIHVPKWLCNMYGQAIGNRRADHATKLGESFSPQEAFRITLIDELVDSVDDLMPRAVKELDKWLKIPEGSFYRTKLNYRQPLVDELISYAEEELDEVARVISLDETQKSLTAYMKSLKNKS